MGNDRLIAVINPGGKGSMSPTAVTPAHYPGGCDSCGKVIASAISICCYPRCYPGSISLIELEAQPLDFTGVPDRIRTCDPQIRNLVVVVVAWVPLTPIETI